MIIAASVRMCDLISSSLYLVVITQRGTRPVSAPVFSQAALAEAGIPMASFDQPQTSTPIKTSQQAERKLEITVEAVEPSKIETEAEAKVFNFFEHFFYCVQIICPLQEIFSIIHGCKPCRHNYIIITHYADNHNLKM